MRTLNLTVVALVLAMTVPSAMTALKDGVFYMNSCSNDGPCCLEGYVGVTTLGELSFNLAGFTSVCERRLVEGFDEVVGQLTEQLPGTFFGVVDLPHTAGPQTMQLTMTGSSLQMKNVAAKRIVASATGTLMTDFDEALKEGIVRDPADEAIASGRTRAEVIAGLSAGEGSAAGTTGLVILIVVMLGVIAYVAGGIAYSRRNGGTWDGPCRHPHGSKCRSLLQGMPSRQSVTEKLQAIRRHSSISTVTSQLAAFRGSKVADGDEVITEEKDGTVIARIGSFASSQNAGDRQTEEEVSVGPGSPSKARRPKRDWMFPLKPVPMGSVDRQQNAVVAAAMIEPRAVGSPRRPQKKFVVPSGSS